MYNSFRVWSATEKYKLSVSGFRGVTSDPFSGIQSPNGMKFTTKDNDNDKWERNCAVAFHGGNAGGWWYNRRTHLIPNTPLNSSLTMLLNHQWHSIHFLKMKIKPTECIV